MTRRATLVLITERAISCQPTMHASRTRSKQSIADSNGISSISNTARRWGNPMRQQMQTTIVSMLATLAVFIGLCTSTQATRSWRLIERSEWLARAPASKENFTGPVSYLIVHHSYSPGVCLTTDACKASMRSMQDFHMDGHGWPDIGYSFAVGGDGNVYEARGFGVVGAHAPHYNSCSIGLLLIGDFVEKLPPAPMMQVSQEFIEYAIAIGQLKPDYILYGHRQVRDTECPGVALYAEVQKWKHWQEVKHEPA